jgi:hypothetical protein
VFFLPKLFVVGSCDEHRIVGSHCKVLEKIPRRKLRDRGQFGLRQDLVRHYSRSSNTSKIEVGAACVPSWCRLAGQFHRLADRLHADLQNEVVRCWFAPHDLPIGSKTWDEIDAAIRLRDKVLLILSELSIKSDWVEDEVLKGFAEERRRAQTVLFPLRLDDAVMDTAEAWAVKLRDQRHIGDFRRWKDHDSYKKSFDRVLRDLKRATE